MTERDNWGDIQGMQIDGQNSGVMSPSGTLYSVYGPAKPQEQSRGGLQGGDIIILPEIARASGEQLVSNVVGAKNKAISLGEQAIVRQVLNEAGSVCNKAMDAAGMAAVKALNTKAGTWLTDRAGDAIGFLGRHKTAVGVATAVATATPIVVGCLRPPTPTPYEAPTAQSVGFNLPEKPITMTPEAAREISFHWLNVGGGEGVIGEPLEVNMEEINEGVEAFGREVSHIFGLNTSEGLRAYVMDGEDNLSLYDSSSSSLKDLGVEAEYLPGAVIPVPPGSAIRLSSGVEIPFSLSENIDGFYEMEDGWGCVLPVLSSEGVLEGTLIIKFPYGEQAIEFFDSLSQLGFPLDFANYNLGKGVIEYPGIGPSGREEVIAIFDPFTGENKILVDLTPTPNPSATATSAATEIPTDEPPVDPTKPPTIEATKTPPSERPAWVVDVSNAEARLNKETGVWEYYDNDGNYLVSVRNGSEGFEFYNYTEDLNVVAHPELGVDSTFTEIEQRMIETGAAKYIPCPKGEIAVLRVQRFEDRPSALIIYPQFHSLSVYYPYLRSGQANPGIPLMAIILADVNQGKDGWETRWVTVKTYDDSGQPREMVAGESLVGDGILARVGTLIMKTKSGLVKIMGRKEYPDTDNRMTLDTFVRNEHGQLMFPTEISK